MRTGMRLSVMNVATPSKGEDYHLARSSLQPSRPPVPQDAGHHEVAELRLYCRVDDQQISFAQPQALGLVIA